MRVMSSYKPCSGLLFLATMASFSLSQADDIIEYVVAGVEDDCRPRASVCANSTASETITLSELMGSSVRVPLVVPAQAVCAWHCTEATTAAAARCQGFNFRPDEQLCDFYDYQPSSFVRQSQTSDCIYYQVSRILSVH